jgi:PPM family protein phosphatase
MDAVVGQGGNMGVTLNVAVLSDLGLLRPNNEDAAHGGHRLIAVADGIGGGPAGEVASRAAITAIAAADDGGELRQAFRDANTAIRRAAQDNPAFEGMGTTLTTILFTAPGEAVIGHIGDSRAYMSRSGRLSRLTRDDTYVQSLVDEGLIDSEQARHHPQKSLITRSLQGHDFTATFTDLDTRHGDRYLLCSDGLSDIVTDESIEDALHAGDDPGACAKNLVRLALQAGAPDNVTVVVAFLD